MAAVLTVLHREGHAGLSIHHCCDREQMISNFFFPHEGVHLQFHSMEVSLLKKKKKLLEIYFNLNYVFVTGDSEELMFGS